MHSYRLLREVGQLGHRRLERPAQKRSKPRALVATQPNQIYCWDISYLPTLVRGIYFYLYLFVDLFSRHIVGWQVYDSESAEQASELLQDICLRQGIAPDQLTVHSDNGSPMKGETMLATMQSLEVASSRMGACKALSYTPIDSPDSRISHLPIQVSESSVQNRLHGDEQGN